MLLFNFKKMMRHWNERGQVLVLPMLHCSCTGESGSGSVQWEKTMSFAEVSKFVWIARDQNPTLLLLHTPEMLPCCQESWAQSCRTHISFPCNEPQLNTLLLLVTQRCALWSVPSNFSFLSLQGSTAVFHQSLPVHGKGRYTWQCLFSAVLQSPEGKRRGWFPVLIASSVCKQENEVWSRSTTLFRHTY